MCEIWKYVALRSQNTGYSTPGTGVWDLSGENKNFRGDQTSEMQKKKKTKAPIKRDSSSTDVNTRPIKQVRKGSIV